MPQGVPTTIPDDGLTTRERRNRPADRRPHRPRQGEVDGRLRPGDARVEPGLQHRGLPVREVRQVAHRRADRARAARSSCTRRPARAGPVTWHKMGSGWSWSRKAGTEEDHAADAAEGWAEIKRALAEERHDLYVLDEFTYPMKWGWVDVDDVVATLADQARSPARRHHRPPRRPAARRGRQPRHRDGPGQAPDGGRAEGPARHRVVSAPAPRWSPRPPPATARPPSPPG